MPATPELSPLRSEGGSTGHLDPDWAGPPAVAGVEDDRVTHSDNAALTSDAMSSELYTQI